MSGPILEEVPEKAATSEIAAIYAELRAALGVPIVNLVFRNMAAVPGCLPWAWACLAPLYRGETLHRAGGALSALAGTARVHSVPAEIGMPRDAVAADSWSASCR